ncbi:LamG-like jellyroll fold domain-containing protein [Streptomyces europaeiscabiei]|uniref:LamG-like jellyroll fold domain-containing protein n=1 Tax=Streptomyces europaeiscabiei TaxID=146819 RepID=UPI0029BDFA17|nr:LamG-like jellyroll fold domain-containing protein [Streptomyces europaeiscabiei]MDX2528249.1 LamG domain protein jellyroll fold domain protein [Streptomyces europaeiscabiei]MDX3711020.1 LamG domain protein jellyroll fold domain protein [Streptomyces europaeiscabiei]
MPVSPAVADEAEHPLSEGQKALAEAQESGKRVEVVEERSARTTVFANPDGFTFTLEESAVPVRVPAADGGWQAPDATLEVRADGTVVPKAAAVGMEFSGGGAKEPLVKISDTGRSLRIGWPGKLPEPELEGTSAVYPEVLPGVDLMITASVEGFRHVLVVKSPEAAAQEELKQIDYALKATGLSLRKGKAGNLTAIDDDGNRVFRAPPAQMWDSAGSASGAQTMSLAGASAVAAEDEGSDPAEAGVASAEGAEPAAGDTVITMDVKVSGDALTVIPDAQMLAKTEASAFPLYIDPTVTWGESERTLLRSDGYESYGWGNGDDGLGKGAGKCGTWSGYYCGPGYVQRLYFEFSPASLKGKQVLDATFRLTEPWAFQCDPRWVDLVRTNNISSSTTWSSRPKALDLMGDRNVSAGRGSLCDPDSPDAPIEFNDNPEETNENLTPTARSFAAGKFSRLTLEIRAHDESDTSAWKRFKNDAVLAVQFVGVPAPPTGPGLVTGAGTVCETDASDPAIVSDPTPTLTGVVQTKAGGEGGASLRAHFYVQKKGSDGSWSLITEPVRPSSGYVGDGVKVSVSSPVTLSDGSYYRMAVFSRSYYNSGSSYLQSSSTVTTKGWCYFKVDPTAPKAPEITVGSPYSACTDTACPAGGGPGQKATFTFAPATGDSNVAYQYKLSTAAAWSTAINGSTVSKDITPDRSGTYSVYVRAKDSVGRWGAQNVVDFLVAAGEGPVGRWHFDETDGTAKDSATGDGSDDATPAGEAARDDRGRRGLVTHDAEGQPLENAVTDKGLVLNGTSGYASTGGQVLETRSSYTVAAWVRVDPQANRTLTVLSQSPTNSPWTQKYSPFYLSYGAGGDNTWSMRVLSTEPAYHEIRSKQPSPRGVWTHVAGVHDATSKTITLYVNGVLQGSTDAGPAWDADGPLQIGRVLHADVHKDFMHGSIDEPVVWQRALTPKEVHDEARLLISDNYAGAELVADFSAARGSGTTLADTTSGYGKALTLTGGASNDGDNIVLDGVDDAAAVSGPLVDDSASFTATTLVELDAEKLAAKSVGYIGQVIGQRTTDGSAWGLWYEMTGKDTVLDEETLEERTVPVGIWHFGRLNTDGTFSSVVSDEVAAVDSPVRLTGIHDSVDGMISLYLGYGQNGDATVYTAKIGSGDFAVGKGYAGGSWQHYLPARVAEVRVWAGAMASPEQVEVRVGD